MPQPQSKPQAAPDFIPAAPPDFIPAESGGMSSFGLVDDRNGIQKSFDEGTHYEPNDPMLKKVLAGTAHGIGAPFIHPVDTAKNLASSLDLSPVVSGTEKPKPWADVGKELPYDLGQAFGGAALGSTAGEVVAPLKGMAKDVGERYGGYSSPVIPKAMQQASKVAQAIRPPEGVGPRFESDLAANMPGIKAFASESGNPLHSQWETAEAARGLANKGLTHYKTNFLGPIENETVSMRTMPEYQGNVIGEGRTTTMGAIEKRLSDINDIQRGGFRGAKTTGQEMTAAEKMGLDREAGKLRDILYSKIAERTGVTPEDVQGLRQGYGQQFGIADAIDSARRARLGQGGATPSVPLSKGAALGQMVGKVFGKPEYFADRGLRKAMQPIESSPLKYPEPKGPEPAAPRPRTPVRGESQAVPTFGSEDVGSEVAGKVNARASANQAAASTNRASAMREFLHANDLEKAAQDASAARGEEAGNIRRGVKEGRQSFRSARRERQSGEK